MIVAMVRNRRSMRGRADHAYSTLHGFDLDTSDFLIGSDPDPNACARESLFHVVVVIPEPKVRTPRAVPLELADVAYRLLMIVARVTAVNRRQELEASAIKEGRRPCREPALKV